MNKMEETSNKGVLSHLSLLEVQARNNRKQKQDRVTELKAKAADLMVQREQLKAEVLLLQNIQKLKSSMDERGNDKEDEPVDDNSKESKLLRLMARRTQLKDLLHAHHLIGGYDVVETQKGKGMCVSLATAFEGVYLETYNLEIDLKPVVRIGRHNIPAFIPLNNIAEQSNIQRDLRTFLDTLSWHLNGFAGRKQQVQLVKEQHKSVKVVESNVLCSLLVLMFSVPREEKAVICRLDYNDQTKCLPTQVSFEYEDRQLIDSPEWRKNYSLLMETPVHKALMTITKM